MKEKLGEHQVIESGEVVAELPYGYAEVGDISSILELIASAPDALLSVTQEEILDWVESKHSLVIHTPEGELIGHQGMYYWGDEVNVVEIRSAYVKPEWRGKGINTVMKREMIEIANEVYPGARVVGFTEAASKSRGILQKLGFEEIDLAETPEELFSICPDNCVKKTGVPCGCKVYELKGESDE